MLLYVEGVQDMLNFIVDTAMPVLNLRKIWHQPSSPSREIRAETLLWYFRTRQATEARDKVFGIRSLITSPLVYNAIMPDYNKATWDAKIFVRTALAIINQTGSLDVLSQPAHARRDTMISLPSWCPNFAATDAPGGSLDRWTVQMPLYNAASGLRTSVSCVDEMIMVTEACLIDTVKRTSISMTYLSHKERVNGYKHWYESVEEHFKGEATEDWKKAFGRTLMGDSIVEVSAPGQDNISKRNLRRMVHSGQRGDEDEYAYNAWCSSQGLGELCTTPNFKSEGPAGPSSEGLKPENSSSHYAEETIKISTMARKLFITKEGKIGVAPIFASYGFPPDEIYVIPGGKTPFILRPLGDKHIHGLGAKQCYQFIGECFLDGFMDGEGVKDFDARKKTLYIV